MRVGLLSHTFSWGWQVRTHVTQSKQHNLCTPTTIQDFYNLELSDTNVVDHNTHDYRMDGIDFEVVDEAN
jgi:hypothetical protein